MDLGMEKRVLTLFLVMFGALKLSIGAVHKVGDSAGWTTIGNVDYKKWASTKYFDVGDIIVFEYNPQFHNVMQVTHDEYKSCNITSTPIATYTTGNDSITLTTRGHHYFLCDEPGHCQAGQKVDINVLRLSLLAPTHSALLAPSVPAPSPSTAAPLYGLKGLFCELGLPMAILATFVHGFA